MTDPVTFDVKYELGHSYRETWEYDKDLYCPACGKDHVWVNSGAGDYYEGPQHMCDSCGSSWSMPRLESAAGSWQNVQRLEAIRGAA